MHDEIIDTILIIKQMLCVRWKCIECITYSSVNHDTIGCHCYENVYTYPLQTMGWNILQIVLKFQNTYRLILIYKILNMPILRLYRTKIVCNIFIDMYITYTEALSIW